mgnify:CR=1 FL=1
MEWGCHWSSGNNRSRSGRMHCFVLIASFREPRMHCFDRKKEAFTGEYSAQNSKSILSTELDYLRTELAPTTTDHADHVVSRNGGGE